jgi:uncharacterized membrane protein YbhN (UPF0104 family)
LANTDNNLEKKAVTEEKHSDKSMKKKLLWTLVFIAIAALTIFAITSQNKDFSLKEFVKFISGVDIKWVVVAVLGTAGFIIFEGLALLTICKAFGYKRGFGKGYIYSAGDIYF